MLLAGFSVIVDQARIVLAVLLLILLGQLLVSRTLRFLFGDQLTSSDYFTLGLSGWLLPASLISLIWFRFGLGFALAFLILAIILLFFIRLQPNPQPDPKIIGLIILLALILIPLRLIFAAKAILPSYFDSAQHYLYIKNILAHQAAIPGGYYHVGFHILASFIIAAEKANIAQNMLILGQLILALLPLSFFFFIKHITRSNLSAFLAVMLAAFGWYMPAHAMDWGKYPALMGVALIPFTLTLFYLLIQNKGRIPLAKWWLLFVLVVVSIVISELAHSRTIIVYGIVFLAWIISVLVKKLGRVGIATIFALTLMVIIWEAVYIQQEPVFGPLFDPYLNKGLWITVLVLLLTIFAFKDFSQIILICLLTIGFLLGSIFIPVFVPGYGALTLLDRPFVEMILFMPLAILGGLGWAGLEKYKYLQRVPIRFGAVVIVMILVVIHGWLRYDWQPSDCCVIAGNDDVAAIAWMNTHLPRDIQVGVSATTMNVLATDRFEGYVGGDAGIWIMPLIDRIVMPVSFDTDFTQQVTLDLLCQKKITHLYVGEMGQSFDEAGISAHPEWYKLLLAMPQAKVYEVVGCK
jgi:hypothetical protein